MRQLLTYISGWRNYLQRFILPIVWLVLSAQLIATPANATGIQDIPNLTASDRSWIIDQADVISRINEGKIGDDLDKLAKDTGKEVRFITIHRFDYGETPESLLNKVFEKWFPTPEAQANQTVLLLDNVTNGVAIRTGDQVKSALPDKVAESVAQETIMVPLRQGNKYNQAFLDASDRLVAVLSGQPDPGPPQVVDNIQVEGTFAKAEETEKERGSATIWVLGLLLAATVIPMATYYLYVR